MRYNELTIDLSIIKKNYDYLKSITNANVGGIVKSDSYGLGVKQCAPLLLEHGCQTFFVAHLDEGIELRNLLGSSAIIYGLHGVIKGEEEEFYINNIIPVINNEYQLDVWAQFAKNKGTNLQCCIHVDTGLNRIGMHISEFNKIYAKIFNSPLDISLVMSQLACGSDYQNPYNTFQLRQFQAVVTRISASCKTKFSLSNSAGILLGKDYHYDIVRPGAALYGIQCSKHPNISNIKLPLKYTSKIIHINNLNANEFVGYECTYKTESMRKIATVPIGYAEKLPQYLSNTGYCVKINKYKAPIVGIISMNLATVDVTDIPEHLISIGQEVVVVDHELVQQISGSQYEFLINFYETKYRKYISN